MSLRGVYGDINVPLFAGQTINGLAGLYEALEDDVKQALPTVNPRSIDYKSY